MTFKPMLAGKLEDAADLVFPVYATPKIDGIRCLITRDGAVSRSLKPIRNEFIRATLNRMELQGLDGELWIPGAKNFGEVDSAVMSRLGRPNFKYLVFDRHNLGDLGYLARVHATKEVVRRANLPWLDFLQPVKIDGLRQLARYEEQMLAQRYEGIMLRSADGPYKHGRSTVREGWLLKLKRFEDDEAVVVGFEEQKHNENEAKKDALGHTERSSHKAGMVGKNTLGALICMFNGMEFSIGTGFTDEQRAEIWKKRGTKKQQLRVPSSSCSNSAERWGYPIGQIVKFRHQPHGAKQAPRCPTFLGFRSGDDL